MKLPHRRQFLHLAAGAAALPADVADRTGASLSVAAGALDRWLGRRQFARHSRAPNGSLAVGAARPAIRHREPAGRRAAMSPPRRSARSAPDGYTLLAVVRQTPSTRRFMRSSTSTSSRDIAPVASIVREPMSWWSIHRFPAKSVPEFIAYAKANPGQAQHGVGRQRHRVPHGWRTFQDDGRHRQWFTCPIVAVGPPSPI